MDQRAKLNHSVFMLKYGSQKHRQDAVHDALHALKSDPTMDDHAADALGNSLWHHVDSHGDNPELQKFMIHLDNIHDEMDDE
jgi:hypothetical protein